MRRVFCSPDPSSPSRAAACLAALLGTALPLSGNAAEEECSCLWQGSFADVQAQADLVIAGSVEIVKGNAIDIRIEDQLRGETWLDSVRVWLQTRAYCRPPAEDFPAGSRWVLALTQIDEVPDGGFDPGTPNQSYGRVGDYYLSSCGGYWLEYRGEAVTGNLVDAPRWAREVEMTPVLYPLLKSFVQGRADAADLKRAAAEDPALDDLLLDTKAFLRGDDALSGDEEP